MQMRNRKTIWRCLDYLAFLDYATGITDNVVVYGRVHTYVPAPAPVDGDDREMKVGKNGESNISVEIESRPEDGEDREMKIKKDSESNVSVEDQEIMVKNDNIPNRLSPRFSNRVSKHLPSKHRISKHRELKRVPTHQILNKHLTKHGVSISRLFNRQHRWHKLSGGRYVKWRERWEWQSCISMFW